MTTQNYGSIKNASIVVPVANTDLGSNTSPYGNLFLSGNLTIGNTVATSSTLNVPKITSLSYPNSATAANPAGGETITVVGSGFLSGPSIYVSGVLMSSASWVNSGNITFTSPVKTVGSYTLAVVNSDGGSAQYVPGITYSNVPVFTTSAGTLGTINEGNAVSNTISATSDSNITFSITSGGLPSGLAIASNGVISGTLANVTNSTTYNFTVGADDQENQLTTRNYSYTVNPDTITWSSPSNNTTYTSYGNSAISNVALSATSTFGRAVTYSANSLPTGLSLSGGNISGTPTVIANSSSIISATTTTKQANIQLNWSIQKSLQVFHGFNTPAAMNGSGTTTTMQAVTVNSSGLFVAVGNDSSNYPVYATSTDGSTWTTPAKMNGVSTVNPIRGVTVNSSGLFVAVGSSSNYPVYATSSNGSTWTTPAAMNGTTTSGIMYGVTVNSSGLFVAVGVTSKASYATSTNGTTWTTPAIMGSGVSARMNSVTVNSAGLFVAVGNDNSNYPYYATSTDGSTWTTPALMNNSYTSAHVQSVTVNSSGVFVAVGYDGNGYPIYATSSNGSTWSTPAPMNGSTNPVRMYGVTVNNGLGLFVAVGCSATYPNPGYYATSTDGSTWTTPAAMNGISSASLMYAVTSLSSGLFVAVGTGSSASTPFYAASN